MSETIVRAEVGHRERIALRKLGNPEGFQFYQWEALGPHGGDGPRDCLLTGCVVTRTHTKGKRKGEPVYDGPPMRVVVSPAEIDEEQRRYEGETGLCAECIGAAQTWAGWNHETGHKYRPCRKCGATGKASESR
jgi:hypothetical protein